LIADDGRALLTDFGFSFPTESSIAVTLGLRHGGTLKWMAPELLDDETPSVRSDTWAFGMTALVCLTFQASKHIPTFGLLTGAFHPAGAFSWYFIYGWCYC